MRTRCKEGNLKRKFSAKGNYERIVLEIKFGMTGDILESHIFFV